VAVLPIVDRLPDPILGLVGEVVTAWAIQENELRRIVYLLLSVDPKRGRLAVKSTRAKDTVDLISDLMHLAGLTSKTTIIPEYGKLLEEIENRRNSLAHNIWLQAPDGALLLQTLTGVWPANEGGYRRKRRIDPAGTPVDEESLRDLASTLRNTIAQARTLYAELSASMNTLGSLKRGSEE
jgi:hypothetical protein